MATFPINSLLLLSRRSYAVASENVRAQLAAASAMKKVVDSSSGSSGVGEEQKEVFWMKDPKTGNWIPETHFGQIDVADLRAKLLTKHKL